MKPWREYWRVSSSEKVRGEDGETNEVINTRYYMTPYESTEEEDRLNWQPIALAYGETSEVLEVGTLLPLGCQETDERILSFYSSGYDSVSYSG